jgi:hypothetical protein
MTSGFKARLHETADKRNRQCLSRRAHIRVLHAAAAKCTQAPSEVPPELTPEIQLKTFFLLVVRTCQGSGSDPRRAGFNARASLLGKLETFLKRSLGLVFEGGTE